MLMQQLTSSISFGLLAIDPVGALFFASVITADARRYIPILFTATFIFGTVILGVVLSLLGQGAVDFIQSIIPNDVSPLWAILNLIVITVIIVWLSARFTKRNNPRKERRELSPGSAWSFAVAGLLFSISSLTDPTFYAVILIAAETHNIAAMIGLHLLWTIIGQIPLVVLFIAYLFNIHTPLLKYSNKVWRAHKDKVFTVLYIVAILLATILFIDTIIYIISGTYWF